VTTINRRDVQGNVVTGYRFPEAAHVFAAVDDAAAVRRWLRGLEVTSDADMAQKPDSVRNVALSHAGLRALSAPAALFPAFPAFSEGMAARAERLGDDRDGYAPFWERAHVWVSLHARSQELLERCIAGVRRSAEAFGVSVSDHVVRGRALLDGTSRLEHFGFRDGMSNPAVAGIDLEAGPGTGKLEPEGRWVPIRAGEFLLGHPNESGDPLPDEKLRRIVDNGTFVVFRQLHQDVAGFRRYTKEAGERFGFSADEIAAKIVGRSRSGQPMARMRRHSEPRSNDFGYLEDPYGSGCPLGAHIRRANPRDATGVTEIVARHRIMRRGMPYGEPLPEGVLDDDGKPRGLLFIAMNASIERQFEFIQERWLNAASASGLGDDGDPLLAACGAGRMVIQGDAQAGRLPILLSGLPRFVTCRGGQYFFMPGISALRAI
jgi:Dyp-type peroxidase family